MSDDPIESELTRNRVAKMLRLSPSDDGKPAGHPEPMDTHGTTRELESWMHRGGRLSPNDELGGGVKMPGGTYGGEFSDAEWAAMHDAYRKLHAAVGQERIAPVVARLHEMHQRPDVTATPTR